MCLMDAVYICDMKKVRVLSLLLTAALTVTSLTVTPSEADAAKKKVSLAKKKVTVAVGQKKKIKIVPAKKKKAKGSAASSSEASKKKKIRAKVKWKSSNKNIAKVVKKKVFVKKANARVMGVAPGTAVVKAVYKRKGVKATLKCKVTVVPAEDATVQSAAPSQSGTPSQSGAPASNAPATDQPGPDRTAKPTKGPTPPPTATPTSNPNTQPPASPNPWPENADSYSFDLAAPREEGGIYSVQDGATWEKNADGSITVTFNKDKNYPDMSFRIPAKYYKPNYYKWVEIKYSGNEGNRGVSIYDKGLLPDHDTAPWECDATTKYDLGPDFLPEYAGDCVKIIALDELEDWTEYATQIDIYAPTVEGGQSAGGKITIKSITLYSDQPGSEVPPSDAPSTPEPVYTPVEPTKSDEIIDGDVVANICADNILDIGYSADAVKKEFPGDGSVKLDLTNENAGGGITVFFKDDHSLVDLSKYKEVQIEVADVGQSGGYGPAIEMKAANGKTAVGSAVYWPNLDNGTWTQNLKSGFGNVSTKKAAAIQIKYNTYEKEKTSPRATLTIKSVKLIASNPVSSEVQTFETETSGNVSLDSSTGYGDVRINEEKFQEFLKFYSDVYTAFDTLNGKEAGQYVTKYTADDEEITYTSSGSGKGTLKVKGGSVERSLNVEFTKDAGAITGKFTDDKGKVREIKVTESAGNVCNITDNGEEGYKLIVDAQKESDDYTVTYLAPTGDYIKLTKVGNKYTLKATKAMIDKYGLSLSYLAEA